MKLELKHLSAYQEHKIKLLYKGKVCNIAYLSTKRVAFIRTDGIGEVIKMTWEQATGKIKLILRPLSDLTKEIEINGEKFIPIDIFDFGDDDSNNKIPDYGLKNHDYMIAISEYNLTYDINFLPFGVVEFLFKWHFDLFGLIPEKLAIDINTLQ